jgi:hypothetical protein
MFMKFNFYVAYFLIIYVITNGSEASKKLCSSHSNPNCINAGTTAGFLYRSALRFPEALEDG